MQAIVWSIENPPQHEQWQKGEQHELSCFSSAQGIALCAKIIIPKRKAANRMPPN